jgi:tRNA threonylcarbamoyladenosine biosynthesis protein TsaE
MDVIFSLDDIRSSARKLMEMATGYQVMAFYGEMGAGKTTLIHAICEEMGVRDSVGSPTFSIINEYDTPSGKTIFHIDLYRLKDEQEAIDAGVEDCLYSGRLCLVEWPEKAFRILPANTLHIYIRPVNEYTRKLEIIQ